MEYVFEIDLKGIEATYEDFIITSLVIILTWFTGPDLKYSKERITIDNTIRVNKENSSLIINGNEVFVIESDNPSKIDYKKYGIRKSKKDQTEKDLLEMHRQIAIWYKLLIEATKFFGERVSPNDVFYSGMNIPLSFTSFNPVFLCPISIF